MFYGKKRGKKCRGERERDRIERMNRNMILAVFKEMI
jgi:hypothetical protein